MVGWLDKGGVIAVVAAVALVGAIGCSEDPEQTDQGEQNQNQVEPDAGSGDVDGDPDTDLDADNGGGATGEDAGDTDDTDDAGGEEPDVPDFPDVESVDCYHPSGQTDPDCEGGTFGPGTFFREFVIETEGEEDACCFDLTGDGMIDNYLGEEVASAAGSVEGFTDINENISNSIWAGELIYLLETENWQHPEWDSEFDLNVMMGSYSDHDMDDNMVGNGSFWVASSNFDTNDEPRFGFEHAHVADGELWAEGGFLEIRMPGLVEGFGAPFGDVRLSGDIAQVPEPDLTSGGSFEIRNGKLGGALLRDRFFRSLNELSYDCECFDTEFEDPDNPDPWTEGVFEYQPEGGPGGIGRWACHEKEDTGSDECTGPSNPAACRTLADDDLCFLLDSLSTNPDMDVQGQPAYSIGVHFETVTTEIEGIGDEQ